MAEATYRSTITADGEARWTDTSYTPDAGADTVGTSSDYHLATFWDFSSPNYTVTESFFGFDLTSPTTGSAPPDGATIDVVTLNLYLYEHGSIERGVDCYAYDWGGTLATDDWRTVAQLQALYDGGNGLFAYYTIPSGWGGSEGSKNFTEGTDAADAVAAALGGTLYLMLACSEHRAGTTPTARGYGGFRSASYATESQRPLLTVEYTAPAGFTGLTVTRILNG